MLRIPHNGAGFTLLELLSIVLLLAIISVVAFSRLDVNPFRRAGFEEELRAAIRFAQKFAIVSGCEVEVDVNATNNSYALRLSSNININTSLAGACLTTNPPFGATNYLPAPDGVAFPVNAPTNVDITAGLTFFYDGQGRPVPGGGTITIENGATDIDIRIEPVTGYVY